MRDILGEVRIRVELICNDDSEKAPCCLLQVNNYMGVIPPFHLGTTG